MSKICVVFHECDLDGWMSAAIVKHWYLTHIIPNDKSLGDIIVDTILQEYVPKEPIFKDTNNLWFIGYNYGQLVPDLSSFDRVIMCDISFPKNEMEKLFDTLGENFVWCDHHSSALKMMFSEGRSIHPIGRQNISYSGCELTWQFFFPNEEMPEIVRLLGRYDCFGHKGTDEEQKVLEFQYGARQCISDYHGAYSYLLKTERVDVGTNILNEIWNSGKAIYQYLCTEAKQVYATGTDLLLNNKEKGEKPLMVKEDCTPVVLKFIMINRERFNPINFGIDYHADGYDGCACYYYDGKTKLWKWSLYNDNGLVDCSIIAKQFGGGGHFSASGFICNNETFLKIINNGRIFGKTK